MAGTIRRGSVLGLATSHKAVEELRNSIGCDSKTIAMLMALNDPERIKAEINRKADSNNS